MRTMLDYVGAFRPKTFTCETENHELPTVLDQSAERDESKPKLKMKFYAHTAEDGQGKPLPEASGKWQPLSEHLRRVADMAREFAEPFGLGAEAELAGLLHDLGKYAERFQARLRNPAAIRGINHWTAGARKAAELKTSLVDYAIDGHHTGLPSAGDLRRSLLKMSDASLIRELTGCAESVVTLIP